MSETAQLLRSLADGIKSRLGFRRGKLISAIKAVVGSATKSGHINSGVIGLAVARPFGEEVQQRAELVCGYLKEARMDWSPRQLLDAEDAFTVTVVDLVKKDLSEAAAMAAQIGTISEKRAAGGTWATVAVSFDNETNTASENAIRMVESTIIGIMQAARTQIEARGPKDRPLFMQFFAGPVAAVAQGESSIGAVTQNNDLSESREHLKELAQLIRQARAELGPEGDKQTAAALEMVQAEAESGAPDWGVVKAATVRVYGFLERAGSSAAEGALLAYLRAHGWVP
jgi:hypothetical protein